MTTGCVAKTTPSATPPTGCVVNASLLAAPTVITTLLEAPVEVRPVRVATSVYVPAAAVPVIWQPANVATPATAATVVAVHERAAGCRARSTSPSVTVPVSVGDGVAVEVLHRDDRLRREAPRPRRRRRPAAS